MNELELEEVETSVIHKDLQVPDVDVCNMVNGGNAPVHQLQCVQGIPISLFTSTTAEQMGFPCLSPNGVTEHQEIHLLQHWIIFSLAI